MGCMALLGTLQHVAFIGCKDDLKQKVIHSRFGCPPWFSPEVSFHAAEGGTNQRSLVDITGGGSKRFEDCWWNSSRDQQWTGDQDLQEELPLQDF